MLTRSLGTTDITVSPLSFGCGNVGGLMVRGDEREQRETVAHALDAGVRYFDTAASYGDGRSEEALGRLLPASEPRAAVGTKVRLTPASIAQAGSVAATIRQSLEASLRRLQRDTVDLFQLHNPIGDPSDEGALPVAHVVHEVLPVLLELKREGKTRSIGLTALGDATSLRQLSNAGGFEVSQVPFSLLNPSAVGNLASSGTRRLGMIGIRVLAGGALGGQPSRHPIATPTAGAIGRGRGLGSDYDGDLQVADRYRRLVDAGAAVSLPALALRYSLSEPRLDTFVVGFSSLAHLQQALAGVEAGPLPPDVLNEVRDIQSSASTP